MLSIRWRDKVLLRFAAAFGIGGVVQVKGSPTPQLKSGGDPVQVKGGQADE